MADQQCPACGVDIDDSLLRDCVACGAPLERAGPPALDQTVAAPAPSGVDATLPGAPIVAASGPADPMIGKQLGGCVIETLLGTGAMGAVYRARQTNLDRVVAVKVVRPELAVQESLIARFRREARTIGRFNTPHVVQVFDFGTAEGVHYIVMEFVAGASLRHHAHQQPDERLSTDDGIRFLAQACEGLLEAQAADVLHRDIKPDNLMLSDRGVLKIADFGIAKIVSQDVELTQASEMTGTPLYMSPEQCRGVELDFRSDMYSLGATFYYLLSGQPPAEGSSVYELLQTKTKLACLRLDKALPDPSAAGPLGKIIERMTQLDPADRYSGYDELLADLRRLEAGEALAEATAGIGSGALSKGATTTAAEREEVEASRVPRGLLIAAVAVLIGGVVAWQAGWFGGDSATKGDSTAQIPTSGGARATHDVEGRPLPFTPRQPLVPEDEDSEGEDPGVGGETPGDESPSVATNPTVPDPETAGADDGDITPTEEDPPEPTSTSDAAVVAEVAAYQAQIEQLTEDFIREGPESVETEASALVEDLRRRPAAFAPTLKVARILDRDVKVAKGKQDSVRGMNRPGVDLDRLDVVERYFEEQRDKAKPTEEASAALVTWLETEFADGFSIDRDALRGEAESRLRDRYEQCQQLQRDSDFDALRPALASLAEAKAKLVAIFPESDFSDAVPRDDIVLLENAIEEFGRAVALRDEVDEILRSIDGVSLSDWRARSEGLEPEIATLRQRVADEGLDMPELGDKLASLESRVRFWNDCSETLDRACQHLVEAQFVSAERALTALAEQHRVDDLDCYQRVDAVRRELAQAFDAMLGRAEVEPARESALRCREQLEPVRGSLASARALDEHLERVIAAIDELARLTAGMASVAGGVAESDGERVDVPAFWIDRTEASREVVRAQLGEIQASDDKALKAEFSGLISGLRSGKFDADPRLPMADVSWNEAVELLRRVGKRLPSPDEWRLAAFGPAGSQTRFPWGDSADPSPAQLNGRGAAVEVDQGGLSARFGVGDQSVHHLAGNVAEWLDVAGDRKLVVGGDYGMKGTRRIRFAAGETNTRRPKQSNSKVGFRGVVRPGDVLRRRGIGVPGGG